MDVRRYSFLSLSIIALGALSNKEPNGDWTFPYQVARAQCLFAAGAAGVQALS